MYILPFKYSLFNFLSNFSWFENICSRHHWNVNSCSRHNWDANSYSRHNWNISDWGRNMIIGLFVGGLCLLGLCLGNFDLAAQDMKIVSGRVLDKTTGKPIDLGQVEVRILGFNTVAQARDVKKSMDEDSNAFVIPDSETHPDDNGYYEITVAPTGAIIFKAEMKDAVLEEVNYRLEINTKIEMGNILQSSTVTVVRDVVGVLDPQGDIDGNYLKARSTISVPANSGKPNARMIVQPVLIDGVSKDTLRYLKPQVVDGNEYALTQERRMAFNTQNDPLWKYKISDTLTKEHQFIYWADTIFLENPNRNYQVKGIIQLEDYNYVYYKKDYFLASSRLRRPLRFLEYSTDAYKLDPNDYKERPRREKRNTAGNISLSFLIGKAELDPSDTSNQTQLDLLKQNLLEIVNGEGSMLKEFHIVGTASPDGRYSTNLKLAQKRMNYALSQITSVLPKHARERVYMTTKAKVASWSEVAKLLEEDSLVVEANEIYKIIKKFPKSHDAQGEQIRRLPYYRSLIYKYLPKLRSVQYKYVHEIFRELTPEEILDKYEHDEDYRSGKKQFALYEYWHLFNMVQDQEELIKLYQRAYNESIQSNGKAWILAANNLAVSYIDKGVVDTCILAPFIDLKIPSTNYKIKKMYSDSYDIINPEAIIANQLIMYLRSYDFRNASRMCQILNNSERNLRLKAFAMCLGGYYKGGKTTEERKRAKEYFSIVESTSAFNKVIMNLAMNTKMNDNIAEAAMKDLDQNNAMTNYLWAIIYGRKGARSKDFMDDMASENYLLEAFRLDPSLIDIAAGDGDIVEDIFKIAKDRYENEK